MPLDDSTYTHAEAFVEQSPFTLEAFRDWLRTKDPEKEFDSGSCSRCVMAQYGAHVSGHPVPAPGNYACAMDGFKEAGLYPQWVFLQCFSGGAMSTFGEALRRCEGMIAGKEPYYGDGDEYF